MAPLRIVIIGGGPAGYEAALVAAEHGADVSIVSREGLGGNSVLWDCVPSKALIVSAEAMGWLQSAHRLGVRSSKGADLAARAVVDMGAVMDRVLDLARNQSADIGKKVEAAGVRLVEGNARLAGREAVEVDADSQTRVLPADVVLVATGSNPRVLPFSRPDGERVFTSRELFALRTLPERLVVVGSGATGAEYAHAFARFGSEVHLISSRDQILPSEDPDAAAVIEDSFERWGMVIHRQRRAVDLERSGDGVRVKVGEQEWVEGTHALFCIGQIPSSARLGLEAAGVQLADNGAIPVDGVSRTNVRNIYAAGDVTGGIMLASVAAMRGRNAMWHALGQPVAPLRSETIAACIFTDPEVASVGVSGADAASVRLPIETITLPFAGNPRAKMAESTDGFVKLHAMAGSGTLLGGVVVADRASDLITPISVAVTNRLTASQVAYTFSIYPSMSGSLQETARQLMGTPTASAL
jgi:pyruvate/2-oxoglutarate dehydrogenase complex dihydrolipoamide dehydrogenase (E3) component